MNSEVKLKDASLVRHYISGVAYALSRSGLEKILSVGYHRKLMPLDEFLPALTSSEIGGHFRIDIRQSLPNAMLHVYATKPIRIVESDSSMSDDGRNPTPHVQISCDPSLSSFRYFCNDDKTRENCTLRGHVVLRVDDRTAYMKVTESELASDQYGLWNIARRFCESHVSSRWWDERSQQREHTSGRRQVKDEIASIHQTCIYRAVQCASVYLRNNSFMKYVQTTPQGGHLDVFFSNDDDDDDDDGLIVKVIDSVAQVILDSFKEKKTLFHVPGERIGRRKASKRNDMENVDVGVDSQRLRPSIMVIDQHKKRNSKKSVASILGGMWYNFVVDQYTNLPISILHHESDNPNNLMYSIDLHDEGNLLYPLFIYDWSIVVFSSLKPASMLFDQLCFKTRTGIVLSVKEEEEEEVKDEVIFELKKRGFELDVLASYKVRYDFVHRVPMKTIPRNVFVFRRKTSRPRQSWIVCNREDECKWKAQFDFKISLRRKKTELHILTNVKQGDSVIDHAVDVCRYNLGRYCTQGNRQLNLIELNMPSDRHESLCKRDDPLSKWDGEVTTLNPVTMRCVLAYLRRYNELDGLRPI